MARDYKHRKRRKKAGSSTSPGFVTGLVCGLAVAVLVHLYHEGQDATRDAPALTAKPAPARSEPPPATEEEDQFEFYDILPEFEVAVPVAPVPEGNRASPARTLPPGSYYLQAGSFRQHADADRRKASLAMLGVTSSIQQVTIDGNQTWFRVRVGPIREADELDAMRARLTAAEIQTLAVRAVEGR